MARILVVDDDPDTCRFMRELLLDEEREVTTAETPEAALAAMEEAAFDLVLSDINLNAGQNGLDLLRAFKARDPEIEVVLISALSGFAVYFFSDLTRALGQTAILPPWLAATAPALAAILIGMTLVFHQEDG